MEKKKILIASFDLAIGGVERSLIGLLNQFDYDKYDVDLMLFKHEGEFLPFLPSGPNLLPEVPKYATFRKSISQIVKDRHLSLALSRALAKFSGILVGKMKKADEPGYLTIQYGWEMSKSFLPKLNKNYDVAIGFLWPHHFIGEKVAAKKKIGWIHTDYSNICISKTMDSQMWNKLDNIVAVSEDCSNTFLKFFPDLKRKTSVIENILSPRLIREQASLGNTIEITKKPGKTIVVTVGRLTHAKGIDMAIKACEILLNDGFDVEWYVVGYGPLEEELRKQIVELNLEKNFFLVGKKTNPYPYIKACDIYVQPSRYEGKAVTIREAQILGKPIVVTNFPTVKSQASDEVDALVTNINSEGIALGIQRLIEDSPLTEKIISNILNTDYGNENEIQKIYQLIDS